LQVRPGAGLEPTGRDRAAPDTEGLTEEEILAIDARQDVANCSITEYGFAETDEGDGEMHLVRYNVTAPMDVEETPVTSKPDAIAGSRG